MPDYRFHTAPLQAPISEMSLLEQSLLFAELAYIAYSEQESAADEVAQIDLRETLFIERDGAQAYMVGNEHDCIVACRGTEPNEWNDVRADLNALMVVAETVGHVHRGFKQEVDELWPQIEEKLIVNQRTLWFTGHSLGGAMAAICAGRCFLSHIPSNPTALFTYGSPRVGDKRYVNHVDLTHYRWVNNNDIVTRMPPAWFGYRHTGKIMYLDSQGKHRKLSKVALTRDRWRGFWSSLKKGKVDHLADHSMTCYLQAIEASMAS